MPEISAAYGAARQFLFSNIDTTDPDFGDAPIVCVEHMRFLPCRPCVYGTPATTPYSDDATAVQTVRQHHSSSRQQTEAGQLDALARQFLAFRFPDGVPGEGQWEDALAEASQWLQAPWTVIAGGWNR